MSGFALPGEMKAERGRGRIEEQPRWRKQTLLRDEPLQRFISPNWATVLAVIGTGIVRWLSAAVRLMTGIRCHGSEIRRGSRRDSVATDSGGGGWFGCWLSGVGLLDWRNSARTTEAFFVGADGVSVQAAAQGLGVEANRQTLRNRELGQLGQTQMWLKRYKTGMFANLANLANVFSPNRPPAGPVASPVSRLSHAHPQRESPTRRGRHHPHRDCLRTPPACPQRSPPRLSFSTSLVQTADENGRSTRLKNNSTTGDGIAGPATTGHPPKS